MRTRTERTTHGICGWGVILVGILVMLGPGAATAEMPRAVYYDVTQVAQATGTPGADSARPSDPAPTSDRPSADPDVCMDPAPPERSLGVAMLLSDSIRP